MVRNIKYIWKKMSYEELKNILKENQKIHSFPLVDDPSIKNNCFYYKFNFLFINFFKYIFFNRSHDFAGLYSTQ